MVRQFRLVNERGNILNLNNPMHFLNLPDGMGQDIDIEYEMYRGYAIKTRETEKPMIITGDILFPEEYGNPYKQYQILNLFITRSQKLYLEYAPGGLEFVRAEIEKKHKIGKSEIIGKILTCPISFTRLEHWRPPEKIIKPIVLEGRTGKKYPYKRPYKYTGSFNSKTEITNGSSDDMPIKITFKPPYINPLIEIISAETGHQVTKWQWIGEVVEGDLLVLNGLGNYKEQFIKLNNINVYDTLHFGIGFESYIYIPTGKHYINVQTQSNEFGEIVVEYYGGWGTY